MNKHKHEQYKELIAACIEGDAQKQDQKLDTLVQTYFNSAMTKRGINPNYDAVFRVGEDKQ